MTNKHSVAKHISGNPAHERYDSMISLSSPECYEGIWTFFFSFKAAEKSMKLMSLADDWVSGVHV